MELPRQVAVAGQDRAQHRESVEGSVRRKNQDDAGDDRDEDDTGVELRENRLGDLPHDRVLGVAVADRLPVGEQLLARPIGILHTGPARQHDH